MSCPFEIVGKLRIGKETDKFSPYSENTYDSGWVKRRLLFNVISGDNRHTLTVEGGSYKDGRGDVYLFSKPSIGENGAKVKGEKFKIPFKERLTSPRLVEVAEFKKFVFDLEKPGRRYLLEKAAEKIKEGTSLTDEELKDLGLESESDVEKALEKSNKKHYEFVIEWDFAEFIKKVFDSGKYENSKFRIKGEYDCTYSEKNGKYYENFIPKRIYLANEDEEEISTATVELYYNKESLDDGSVEEKGKYFINGYIFCYDGNRKSNIPCPYTITLDAALNSQDEKSKKIANLYKKIFTVDDDSWKVMGVTVNLLNGAQKVEIDESMLTDEQREFIELEILTLDDIRKELGGSVYGEKVQENQFIKPAKGYSKGRQDTVYTDDDFVIKAIETDLPEEVEDLFADDDDEL